VLVVFLGHAQDKIIRNSGHVIHCKILNSDSTCVVYQNIVNKNKFQGEIDRSQINKIEFGRGKILDDGIESSGLKQSVITIGILRGGGSLAGADVELLLAGNLSEQFGTRISSLGAGLNIHFRPDIN
jgi:hypothetical protein